MFKKLRFLLLFIVFLLPSFAGANDEPWSGPRKIMEIQSGYSKTQFKLTDGNHFCGTNDSWWDLPIDETSASKIKHSLLITAYAAGKTVNLRCEVTGSYARVTDFTISD